MLAAAAAAPAPLLYSPDSDPFFAQPYVDIDEWRDAPVRHRYVHGGFMGADARISFYLPGKEQYQGRFFQHIPRLAGMTASTPAAAISARMASAS